MSGPATDMFFIAIAIVALAVAAVFPFAAQKNRVFILPLADLVAHVIGGVSIILLASNFLLESARGAYEANIYRDNNFGKAEVLIEALADRFKKDCANATSLDCQELQKLLASRVHFSPRTGPAISVIADYRHLDPLVSPDLKSEVDSYSREVDAFLKDRKTMHTMLLTDFRLYVIAALTSAFSIGMWRRWRLLMAAVRAA